MVLQTIQRIMKDYSQCLDELPSGPGAYLARNKRNWKGYNGQAWNIQERIVKGHMKQPWYESTKNKCPAFYAALRKHGFDAFTWHVLWEATDGMTTKKELDMMEVMLIKHLSTHVSQKGYNIAWGGSSLMKGRKHTAETIAKISAAQSGEKNHNFGKKASEETRDKMSAARSGEKHPNFGKKASEETKKKMSAAQSGEKNHNFGKKQSAEHIAAKSKPILGKRKFESEYTEFKNRTAAAEHFKCSKNTVKNIATKRYGSKKFDFKYKKQ